jgi:predicted metal-dependent hydrolase
VLEETFRQGVEAFNQQRFYECHDLLESIWMESPEAEKKFYQGILQIAVACYHLGHGNWQGTVVLLGEGIGRLADFQPTYRGIEVSQLRQDSYRLLQRLQPMSAEEFADFIRQFSALSSENSRYEVEGIANLVPCTLPKIVKIKA